MSADLATLAQAAGLTDSDLLQLADTALATPEAQLAQLRARFPGAFPKNARDMTPAEFKAAVAEASKPKPPPLPIIAGGKHASAMSESEWRAALAQVGFHKVSFMGPRA